MFFVCSCVEGLQTFQFCLYCKGIYKSTQKYTCVLFCYPLLYDALLRCFCKLTMLYPPTMFIAGIPCIPWMQPSTAISCYTATESLFSLQTLPKAKLRIVRTLPVVSCSHLAWCSGWSMAGTAQGFSLVFPGIAWTVLPVLRVAWWYPCPGKRRHMLTATSFTLRGQLISLCTFV